MDLTSGFLTSSLATVTVSTPFSMLAFTWATLASSGSRNRRRNLPLFVLLFFFSAALAADLEDSSFLLHLHLLLVDAGEIGLEDVRLGGSPSGRSLCWRRWRCRWLSRGKSRLRGNLGRDPRDKGEVMYAEGCSSIGARSFIIFWRTNYEDSDKAFSKFLPR